MAAAPKDLKAKFEAAAAAAKQTKKKPDNATLLKLYSYYKQATEGDVKGDRPGLTAHSGPHPDRVMSLRVNL